MFLRFFAILCLLSFSSLTFGADEKNHSQTKHKNLPAKSANVSTNPDYSSKNKPIVHDSINEGVEGEINDIVVQRVSNILAQNSLQNFISADRVIGFGTLIARLIIILAIFSVAWKAINRFTLTIVESIVTKTKKNNEYFNAKAIANTAGPILNSALHWFISAITLLIVLSQIGVDILPIIYSFGVFSLAISIGAQTLVKDVISGILTLFEGIVAVGETVEINGIIGKIDSMSLRAIELRHNSGKLQIISFSEITSLINLSRDYTVCKILLPIAHEANLDEVEKMFNNVYLTMKNNNLWNKKIKTELIFSGVDSITENATYVTASMKTAPDPSDAIGNEFRRILHTQMHNLKIPFPKCGNFALKE